MEETHDSVIDNTSESLSALCDGINPWDYEEAVNNIKALLELSANNNTTKVMSSLQQLFSSKDKEGIKSVIASIEASIDRNPNIVFGLETEEDKAFFAAYVLDIGDAEFGIEKLTHLEEINPGFKILYNILLSVDNCTAVLEYNYVDRVYRDSYYYHFSSKNFSYGRFCKRLCLFNGIIEQPFFDVSSSDLEKIFIGSVVIRPIPKRGIGRTLLNPKYFIKKSAGIRIAKYNITIYGKRLYIDAFPYSMQDGEITTCAEITILNMLDYFSKKYPEYHYLLPSEINQIADRSNFERSIPTSGLSYEVITKIFSEAGFSPRLYKIEKHGKTNLKRMLHHYIDSGIPVALGLNKKNSEKHSIIVIGYSIPEPDEVIFNKSCSADDADKSHDVWVCDTADAVNEYCVINDNVEPYYFYKCEITRPENVSTDKSKDNQNSNVPRKPALKLEEDDIECLMVPLYKRMDLEASDAYDICLSILSNNNIGWKISEKAKELLQAEYKKRFGNKILFNANTLGTIANPFVIRFFMTSTRSFRKHIDKRFADNHEVRDFYNFTTFPKFIWVCELSTLEMYKEGLALGEIVIDATSSPDAKADSSIIIHYPGYICTRSPDDLMNHKVHRFFDVKEWKPFLCFDGNLKYIKNE